MKKCCRRTVMPLIVGGLLLSTGCLVFPDGAGMMTPAPCTTDTDCPEGIACIFPNGGGQDGICGVDDTLVSTGTPAPCSSDADCPEGIACVFAGGMDQGGFCDVDEMQAP